MIALDLNSIAQLATSRIADSLLVGTLIALLAGGVLVVARRLSSETRFALWFSALIAIASSALVGDIRWSSTHLQSVAHPVLVAPASWGLYVFVAWSVIAAVLLARVAVGVLQVIRLRNSCVPLDSRLIDAGLREALELRRASRHIALCTSELVNVPTAIGFVRPAVVLPVWLLEEVSAAELKQLVLHEVTHLRRHDDWTNLAQQIVKALFFFHPAVWWIERRISLEREMACDDAVIAETADPRAYAECLTHLAEKSMIRRGLALAQAALGRVRQTSLRVAEILRRDRRPVPRQGTVAAAALIAGIAIACGIAVSRAPRLIAFAPQDSPSVAARSIASPQINLARRNAHSSTSPAIHPATANSMKSAPRAVKAVAKARTATSPHPRPELAENASAPQSGVVLPTRWNAPSPKSAPATEDVYFVMETRQYLASGVVLYRTSVWRITVTNAADNPATRVLRKEI